MKKRQFTVLTLLLFIVLLNIRAQQTFVNPSLQTSTIATNKSVSPLREVLLEKLKTKDKIKLDLFVMSQCPFGVRAEETLLPLVSELGERIEFQLYFVGWLDQNQRIESMHGQAEVDENFRQVVISKLYPTLLTKYLLARAKNYQSSDWKSVAQPLGILPEAVERTMASQEGQQWLLEAIRPSMEQKIFASPTVLLDGEKYRGRIMPLLTTGAANEAQCNTPPPAAAKTADAQCSGKPDGSSCNDGNPCTQTDACESGVCIGKNPKTCNDNNACTSDVCDKATGACVNIPKVCSDNSECTVDACNPANGQCVFTALQCDDNNPNTMWAWCDASTGCHYNISCQAYPNNIAYVNAAAMGSNLGNSWANAFTDLPNALFAAKNCGVTQIWVAKGTYKPTQSNDPTIAFEMVNGVAIYGGFDGTETQLLERNWQTNVTILSGDIGTSNSDDNSYSVINNNNNGLTATAILDGFTITGVSSANPDAGAMRNISSSPTIRNCTFIGNTALFGGGMHIRNASPIVINCVFQSNVAKSPTNSGGAIYIQGSTSSPQITNCRFIGNLGFGFGGAVSVSGGTPTFNSCIFLGNKSNMKGGGCSLTSDGTTQPIFNNCSFSGNEGRALWVSVDVSTTLKNCIFWGNDGEIDNENGTVAASYCIVQQGSGVYPGIGNLNVNPLFISQPSIGLGTTGDLRLQGCSLAIDAGTNQGIPTTDLEGNVRVNAIGGGGTVDIGAYEYQGVLSTTARWYVNAAIGTPGNGTSWNCAFKDLQSALAVASSGDEIWVAAGTYKPTADPSGNTSPANARTKTFVMKNGVAIYGGFNGTETQLSARNWRSNPTILSGNIGDTGIDTDNSYRVINNTFTSGAPLDNTAILDGFIVEKGYADGSFPLNLGGGMWNSNASPKIQNCVFRNSYASSGGGMFNNSSSSSITNCLFVNNTVTTDGAGISNGGGTDMVKVINCTFYGNAGPTTIANERAATSISNSIVWGNGGGISGGAVTYCTVQGGFSGTGNSNIDPRFVNSAGGDFRLQQCSPAIDNGTNADVPATDFEGNIRPFNATGVSNADMGAYEYQSAYDFCLACANTQGSIVYVNASVVGGSDNGSSWTNAFRDLQSALSLARANPSCVTQIWVAKGTYKPTSGIDRGISFSMVNGVAMYGGFVGGETQLSERNWVTNETILSGDIDGSPDVVTGSGSTLSITGNDGNSYHVIYNDNNGLTASSILNGFTISGGNASANTSPHNNGGGMYIRNASPSIVNCKFVHNNASSGGGGGYFNSPNAIIENCIFTLNGSYSGGGVQALSSLTFNNCQFIGNRAASNGGGISISSQNAETLLTNCQVTGNSAVNSYGGGISSFGTLTILSSKINNNTANSMAGVLQSTRSLIMTNCEVMNNAALTSQGAALNIQDAPNATLTNCVISGNSSQTSHGGISVSTVSAFYSQLTFINSTIANNTSLGVYKAIWTAKVKPQATVVVALKNTIIANNPGGNFLRPTDLNEPSFFGTIQSQGNNLDSDGSSGLTNGVNGDLVNVNPLFVSSTDVRLQPCSPAINAGDPSTTSATVGNVDLGGNPRFYNNERIDMGAYEYQSTPPAAITPTVSSSNPTTCGGVEGSITLSGFLANTIYSVTYKKNNVAISAANFTSNSSGVITLTGLGVGSYTDIVATYGVCVSNAVTTTLEDPAKPSLTLGTIPAICASATTFSIPYNNPTDSPNKYTITGMGITTVSDGDLTSPITVQLNGPSSGSLISFTLTVKNSTTTCVSNSIQGSVTVDPVSAGGSIAGSATVCSGTNSTTLTLSGQVGAIQKWQSSLSSDFSGAVDIANTTTELTASNLTQTTYYRAIVKNGVCSEAISSSATVTVDPVSAGGSIAGSATVCSGTNSTTLTLSGQVGAIQKWQSSLSSDFSGAVDIANTTMELTASNLTQTTYYRAIVKSGVCSQANSTSVTVTVDPVSVGGSIAGSATVCSGTNSTTLTLSGQVGTIQKWQSSLSSDFSGAVDIANTTTELTASNLTQTTYYRAVVKSGVCSQTNSTSTTVTVDPVSVGGSIAGSATVCSGVNSTTLTLSSQVGTIQKWQSSLSSDFSGAVDIANTTTELTASNLTQTTYYRAIVKSGVCSQTNSTSATVTVDPVSVGGSIAGSATVCSGVNSTVLTLSGQVGTIQKWQLSLRSDFSSATDISNTTTELTASNLTQTTYYRAVIKSGVCSQAISMTARIQVQMKPIITLTTLQQTLNEGNAQTFCDTDANPINGLQFTVSGGCVVGTPVWRVQVGSGAWSEWMTNAPVSQSSTNQPHRYQAACDASCPVTYTSPIELTINYRASTPQNVSLVADGVTVNAGETKEVCNIEGNALMFNATCGVGEMLLYSVDGGEYSSTLPTQLVDGQYHNYRVRCRKSDGTVSCVESESGVMRLRIVSSSLVAPVASLNVTSGCGSPVPFSGTANCGALTTIWYNALTNVALSSLPNQTPTETTSYYARCQAGGGCLSEKSNVVTYTVIPLGVAPAVTVSQEIVCTGTTVRISANCPAGSQTFWNTGVTASSFEVSFSNVTKQSYWAKCLFEGGCQSAESVRKDVYWNAFVVTLINIGESKSAVKVNNRSAWTSQFITRDGGPELEQSTQINPTLYYVENTNKMAPRYWTINVDACELGTNGSLTFDMLATPEMGVLRSFNTHENNAPYFMYANREGWTELYAQNHPAYGFYQDNGAGGNVYDAGLPKGLYKLGIRYWDQKGWGSIYPSTRKAQGNVLVYQEYWFRIQSKDGVGVGAAREGANGSGQVANGEGANGKWQGAFATVLPNPVTHTLRLKVQDSKGQVVQAALMDAAGRDVLSRQFVPETNTHQEEFGVNALPAGLYFLKVTTSEKQATLKVVKVP